MTTWNELTDYVRRTYKVANEEPGMMAMLFGFEDGRSQSVFLAKQTLMGGQEEWLQIMSPIVDLSSANVDLKGALEEAGGIVCGGLALMGSVLVIQHALLLQNLDINEFEAPLGLVTATADDLEKKLVGGDSF